jgi:broad specificity phosphatase PhoE
MDITSRCNLLQHRAEGDGWGSYHLGSAGNSVHDDSELGENDRSATGYLSEPEFDAVVDEFFGRPEDSVRGWERAVDAQRRIIAATKAVLTAKSVDGDVAIVAHGGTGTLLLCHLLGVPISRDQDQPPTNGGNYFAFDLLTFQLLHGWRSIDTQHVKSYQKCRDRTK